jgi:hypothetical protein
MKTLMLFLVASMACFATDITGNIDKLVGQHVPSGAYVELNLLACPSPRVSEVAGRAVRLYFRVATDSQGNISGFVLGNDKVKCGNPPSRSSAYNLTIRSGNAVMHSRSYKIIGDKWNLNEATPLN